MSSNDRDYPNMEQSNTNAAGHNDERDRVVPATPPPVQQQYNQSGNSGSVFSGSPNMSQQGNLDNNPNQGYPSHIPPMSAPQNNYVPPIRQGYTPQAPPQYTYQSQSAPVVMPQTIKKAPQTQPNSPYKFDYNTYETYGQSGKQKNKSGLMVFVIILVMSLLLGLIGISVASISGNLLDKSLGVNAYEKDTPNKNETDSGSALVGNGEEANSNKSEGKTEIPQTVPDKKSELIIPPAGELLTTPQVAAKSIPSVVGIMRYESSYYEATGLGSGFMMLQEGNVVYVTTNAHVVDGGTDFSVRLFDERTYDAKLVGKDSEADLAVLSFVLNEGEEVVVAEMGDSDALLVGETVIAIGNPVSVELSSSVTQGIVSALNRQLQNNNTIGYIQTDAAINPGNSGGALLNLYGQVIGINSMKAAGVDVEGLGFAIPVTDALPLLTDLIDNGRITIRPVLGIQGRIITEMEAMQLDCPVGIMVMEPGEHDNFTPELLYEDIITHVNGVEITTLSELKKELEKNGIGDTVTLTVYRKTSPSISEEISIEAVLISSDKA